LLYGGGGPNEPLTVTLFDRFLEKVYENALVHELRKADLSAAQQPGITVRYDDIVVRAYTADTLVEGVVVELKTVKTLDNVHTAQCIDYLRVSNVRR
jgi:GxxExxY protein